jgi:hypothetical protein
MLVALFLWSRVRRRLGPWRLLYPLAMGLTLAEDIDRYCFEQSGALSHAPGAAGDPCREGAAYPTVEARPAVRVVSRPAGRASSLGGVGVGRR